MSDQAIVQEWQPFFLALAGAAAALAGLVFVALSLHPGPILINPLTRARAFAAAFGFLLGVSWSLILLFPARTAPIGGILLVTLGVVESAFVGYRQFQIRAIGISLTSAAISDLLLLTPIVAGLVGLLQPRSEIPFLLVALAAGTGLFVLFSQAWTLVLHSISVTNAPELRRQEPQSVSHAPDPVSE